MRTCMLFPKLAFTAVYSDTGPTEEVPMIVPAFRSRVRSVPAIWMGCWRLRMLLKRRLALAEPMAEVRFPFTCSRSMSPLTAPSKLKCVPLAMSPRPSPTSATLSRNVSSSRRVKRSPRACRSRRVFLVSMSPVMRPSTRPLTLLSSSVKAMLLSRRARTGPCTRPFTAKRAFMNATSGAK